MFWGFRMGPAVNGRGLCDLDKVLFRVGKSRVKKWKAQSIGIFSSCQDLPIFWHMKVTIGKTHPHLGYHPIAMIHSIST